MKRLPALALALLLAGCSTPSAEDTPVRPPDTPTPAATTEATAAALVRPNLQINEVVTGLDIPWGLTFTPDGTMLFTERSGKLSSHKDGQTAQVRIDLDDLTASSEGGLLDLTISPQFASDRRIYTCYNSQARDVRVVAWTMAPDYSAASDPQPIVTGMPMSNGRHSGCRLVFGDDDMLYIGTGDAALPTTPQDLGSLGGKVLRVDAQTGQAPPDNPFADSDNANTRLVYNYGHRNTQGLAQHPTTGELYSVEHGSDIEDEVNTVEAGANYGWNPGSKNTRRYDEGGVPMTDLNLPDAVPAIWNSGDSTVAASGAGFVSGEQWGSLDGALMVACLKGQQLLAVHINTADNTLIEAVALEELSGTQGRLRTAVQGPDGSLYLATSNGGDDKILRVTPSGAG